MPNRRLVVQQVGNNAIAGTLAQARSHTDAPPRCSPGFEKNHTTSLLGESDCFPTVVCSHAVRRVFDGTNCVEPVRCASGMLALNVDLCTTSNEFYCATGYNRTVGSSGFRFNGFHCALKGRVCMCVRARPTSVFLRRPAALASQRWKLTRLTTTLTSGTVCGRWPVVAAGAVSSPPPCSV